MRPPNGSRLSCGRLAHRGASMLNDSACRPAHNTPFPLERSLPASFKRLLGGGISDPYSSSPRATSRAMRGLNTHRAAAVTR